jgi:hypothetical protein
MILLVILVAVTRNCHIMPTEADPSGLNDFKNEGRDVEVISFMKIS